MCVSKCTLLYSEACAHLSPCSSVCALFKPTVSKALQGSLCIIGDLLLSAHCFWQIWIGDCQADMLINDNHNWYLLIAKDEKSCTSERKRVRMTKAHTHTHTFAHFCTHPWLQGWRVFVCHLCLSVFRPFLTLGWSHSNQPIAEHDWCQLFVSDVTFSVCVFMYVSPMGGWVALVMCVI